MPRPAWRRASAPSGRATGRTWPSAEPLRLALINIGGGRTGISDMALLGHPGKLGACLAEAEESSPWEPLHVGLGFEAEESVVTVVGTEAPHSVMAVTDGDDPASPDRVVDAVVGAFSAISTNNALLRGGSAVVVLNPEHAAVVAGAGWSRADVAAAVHERAGNPRARLARAVPAFAGSGDPDDFLRCFATPDDVLVLVAGGGGLYSAVFPTWCAGGHANRAISVTVELDQACAIPGMG